MKTRCIFYLAVVIFLLKGFLSIGFAQSQCIIAESKGGLVTVTCPGEGTKVINMGGSADIYKVGDKINVPGQTERDRDRDWARDAGRKGR